MMQPNQIPLPWRLTGRAEKRAAMRRQHELPPEAGHSYIFRRYSPPTSYSAWLIWPSEQVLTASINASKVLPRARATACRYCSAGPERWALRAWKA